MTRTSFAVVLEIVFATLAFGVRSFVQWRRTGSTGLVLPRRDAPALERLGALSFIAALVLLVAAPVADAADTASRWSVLDNVAAAAIGAVIAIAGIALCVVAQFAMGNSWRIGVDADARTKLVTGGIFTAVRNPIYSSMILAAAGIALLLPNVYALAAFAALLIGLELQVRFVEEPYLRRVHGAGYVRYTERAGRFVPGIGRRRPAA
jgi:protein-S-isoprenylcysteine O-methyltransferase Ste14